MKREKVTVKFHDGRDDIIMVSDSISIYDTTEGTTIIKSQGYVDRVIPSDNIKSISLEHLQDKTLEGTLDRLHIITKAIDELSHSLYDMSCDCDEFIKHLKVIANDLEEV